jgi:hypothetical protein
MLPSTLTRGPADDCPGTAAPVPPRPVYAACVPGTTTEPLTILHLSDLHAHFQPAGGPSPYALIRAYVDDVRQSTGGHALFFDAGDDYEKGSLAELASAGDATRHLLPYLRPDVRILGNHDFAYGETEVLRDIDQFPEPVLDTNIRYTGANPSDLAPFTFLQVGCARIGVFGLVTQGYDQTDQQTAAAYLSDFSQDPGYVAQAQAMTQKLRSMGADAVIAITHLGASTDQSLVDQVAGLDLVLGGHDHDFHAQAYEGAAGGRSSDVGAFAAYLGRFDVTVDLTQHRLVYPAGDGFSAVQVDSVTQAPAADVTGEVDRMLSCFAPDWNRPLVYVQTPLDPSQPSSFEPVLDQALASRFPGESAIIYESWSSDSILKTRLGGKLTPQNIVDALFVERELPGTPGFTSFYDVPIDGAALASLCAATLTTSPGPIHRVCPSSPKAGTTYHLVIDKRDFYDPWVAFKGDTSFMPPTSTVDAQSGIEAYDVLLQLARTRGSACQYLDSGTSSPCP